MRCPNCDEEMVQLECDHCNGSGELDIKTTVPYGYNVNTVRACSHCNGSGHANHYTCPYCAYSEGNR